MKVRSRKWSGFKGSWFHFGIPGKGIKQDSGHPGPH